MKRGYEERHYDAMLLAFGALNISEHRLKPEATAQEARARADAFVAELVKIDAEAEARDAADDAPDITHDNADKGDTEPPPPPSPTVAQLARLAAQEAESKMLASEIKSE